VTLQAACLSRTNTRAGEGESEKNGTRDSQLSHSATFCGHIHLGANFRAMDPSAYENLDKTDTGLVCRTIRCERPADFLKPQSILNLGGLHAALDAFSVKCSPRPLMAWLSWPISENRGKYIEITMPPTTRPKKRIISVPWREQVVDRVGPLRPRKVGDLLQHWRPSRRSAHPNPIHLVTMPGNTFESLSGSDKSAPLRELPYFNERLLNDRIARRPARDVQPSRWERRWKSKCPALGVKRATRSS